MNDRKAILAMKFENIESIGDEDNWAEKLTSHVSLMT